MTFQFEREGETGILTLTGALTIDRADELRSMLLENRKNIQRMVIKPVDVSTVDLTCFQVLCSDTPAIRCGKKRAFTLT